MSQQKPLPGRERAYHAVGIEPNPEASPQGGRLEERILASLLERRHQVLREGPVLVRKGAFALLCVADRRRAGALGAVDCVHGGGDLVLLDFLGRLLVLRGNGSGEDDAGGRDIA